MYISFDIIAVSVCAESISVFSSLPRNQKRCQYCPIFVNIHAVFVYRPIVFVTHTHNTRHVVFVY